MKKMFIAISLLFSLTITSANAVEVSVEAKITGLYVAYFNRAADQEGLKYWVTTADNVAKQGGDVSSVFKTLSGGFATHPTFTTTYEHLNNEEFVAAIYRNSLGRDGDAEGIAYWTDLLDRSMIRSDMVATFVELSMVTNLTPANYPSLSAAELAAAQLRQDLITNKVRVAVTFTNQLGTLSNVVDSDDPESDPAYLASIKIISEVNEELATVTAVLAFIDDIRDHNTPIGQINASSQIVFDATAIIHDVANLSEFRKALEDAALNGSNDVIILDTGVYSTNADGEGTFVFSDTEEYGLKIRAKDGLTKGDVVLDGEGINQILNVKIGNTSAPDAYGNITGSQGILFLENITLINGNCDLTQYNYESSKDGAALWSSTSLDFKNINVKGNTCTYGNVLYQDYKYGYVNYVKVVDSNLSENNGGVIYTDNIDWAELTNTTVSKNVSNRYNILYLEALYPGTATLLNCTISHNNAGAILQSTSSIAIQSSAFNENKTDGNALQASEMSMHDSVMENNIVGSLISGGGMGNFKIGIFARNKFINNTTSNTSARALFSANKAMIINNIFQNNSITKYSGSIAKIDTGYAINNTFLQNGYTYTYDPEASEDLYISGPVINSVFDNTESMNAIKFKSDGIVYNTYVDYAKLIYGEYTIIKKDNQKPSYGDISMTENGELQSDSLAVDTGLNPESDKFKELIGNDEDYQIILDVLQTDLVGNSRIVNGTIDMGALEYGSSK